MRRVFGPLPDEQKLPVRVLIAYAALCLSFTAAAIALGLAVTENSERIDEIEKVRLGICNVRESKIRSLLRGERFVVDNPGGTSGFSRELLEAINADTRREIRNYRPLDCGGLAEPRSVSRLP